MAGQALRGHEFNLWLSLYGVEKAKDPAWSSPRLSDVHPNQLERGHWGKGDTGVSPP